MWLLNEFCVGFFENILTYSILRIIYIRHVKMILKRFKNFNSYFNKKYMFFYHRNKKFGIHGTYRKCDNKQTQNKNDRNAAETADLPWNINVFGFREFLQTFYLFVFENNRPINKIILEKCEKTKNGFFEWPDGAEYSI